MDMKKLVFATLFVVSAGAALAQGNINKGDLMVGGNASFSTQKEGDYKTSSFGLAPNAGYFFINNLAGGLRVAFNSHNTDFGTVESSSSEFSLAPFVRYYFLPSSQKVNLFADASFGFGQYRSESGSVESKTNFTELGIMAGPAIFLTPNTALEFALGFTSSKFKDVEDRESVFGINVGFQIHLAGKK